MNFQKSFYFLMLAIFLFSSGCEVKMGPSQFWGKLFRTQTDSKYYMGKTEDLVHALTEDIAEYEINKVTVFDLVDEENKTPILGEYISTRIVEAITKKYFFRDKEFRVAQKGEVNSVLKQLKLKTSYHYDKDELRHLGKALNSQAVITGRITDLGTNLDVHLTLTDVMSGEVIASVSEPLTRTKFAVEMLRHH